MKNPYLKKRIILQIIISLILLIIIGCNLSTKGYEGIEYEIDEEVVELRYNTINYIEYNYYHLEATDEEENFLITMIFPTNDVISIFDIPYDQSTKINYHDLKTGDIYSASASGGNGLIMIDSSADSIFNELSGTFECNMINVENETDTLTLNNGYFIFVF